MSRLQIDRIVKRYGDVQVVKSVSLAIEDGEFVSLLGPSGCGKTTILRMVAGLIEPTSGAIKVGERDITQLPPNKRQMGLVFQSYALFPHLTVFENVAFGLRRQGQNGAELEKRVLEALSMVRLDGFAQRYPRQLSGGQQQRVAMARAIAPRPTVLLFDEPLSNLDAKLRDEMQIELKRLQRELKITTLFVTHDQGEALSLSDRVCVMYDGVIQQFATPEEIYHRPATAFVAGFIGKPNKFAGEVMSRDGEGGTVRIGDGVTLRSDLIAAPARRQGRRLHPPGIHQPWRPHAGQECAFGPHRAALFLRPPRPVCGASWRRRGRGGRGSAVQRRRKRPRPGRRCPDSDRSA